MNLMTFLGNALLVALRAKVVSRFCYNYKKLHMYVAIDYDIVYTPENNNTTVNDSISQYLSIKMLENFKTPPYCRM